MNRPDQTHQQGNDFYAMLMQVPAAIAVLEGPEHRFFLANQGYQRIFGRTEAQLLGRSVKEAFPESLGQGFHQLLDELYQSGQTYSVKELPARLNIADQTQQGYYDVDFQPLKTGDGEPARIMAMVIDVTERVASRKQVEQSEARFRSLANSMPQVVWSAEPDGTVGYYNDRVQNFKGAKKVAEGIWAWEGMVHPDDLLVTQESWNAAVKTGLIYEQEHRIQMNDGGYRWHLSRAIPQFNEAGVLVRWFGTATDIHEQIMFAEKLERLVAERTEQLQRSNEDLQQFAHVASHDLKEPVRKIMTFISRLRGEFSANLAPQAQDYLARVDKASLRMYSMIDGVLLYSSLNALEQTKELIDLNEIADNVRADLEVMVEEKNASLTYDDLPSIEGSPILIYQLFYNLIGNSLKFTRAGVKPAIVIHSEPARAEDLNGIKAGAHRAFVRIVVSDNGIGFSPEDAPQIFGTFTRLHSKDRYEGTGLGLSLCRKIAERHGGAIWAQGHPDQGASFTVLLPLG